MLGYGSTSATRISVQFTLEKDQKKILFERVETETADRNIVSHGQQFQALPSAVSLGGCVRLQISHSLLSQTCSPLSRSMNTYELIETISSSSLLNVASKSMLLSQLITPVCWVNGSGSFDLKQHYILSIQVHSIRLVSELHNIECCCPSSQKWFNCFKFSVR